MSESAPRIDDYGFLGDGNSVALVSRGGSIDWCCMPRLDRGSCFGRLLDEDAGHCLIAPREVDGPPRRAYDDGTMILTTRFTTGDAELELRDCFLLGDHQQHGEESMLLRVARATGGSVQVEVEVVPRFDYGAVDPWIRRHGPGAFSATGGDDAIMITGEPRLRREGSHALRAEVSLAEGECLRVLLRSLPPEVIDREAPGLPAGDEPDALLEETARKWRSWSGRLRYDGPDVERVRRSTIVLRALSHERTGAIAAAATTSLPEGLGAGGERNWDYRYSWIRDSTLATRSLAEVGFDEEADAFSRFIARSAAGNAGDLQVVFGVGGERRLTELELPLRGFRGATPVRVGNGAAGQLQLDAYGFVLEQSWRRHERGQELDDDLWRFLRELVEAAIRRWEEPDAGFWEAREPRQFTHSKVHCWAAVDRGIRLARADGRDVPLGRWEEAREEMRERIDARGVDERRGVFVRDFESRELDAALLRLPTVDYCDWGDERMLRTADAIAAELDFDGLLRRYTADDGLEGEEGAFLACSFWLAECYARQGRVEEAQRAFDATMETANDLGLFAEEYDPRAGEMLGNFPQALTHLAHLEAALALTGSGAREG